MSTPNTQANADDLSFQLLAAANYIDALGGDSKSYRAALASQPAQAGAGETDGLIKKLMLALTGMLTQFGMDEDEENAATFEAARHAYDFARITSRPLEPHERHALSDIRRTVHGWHERAVALGADGVCNVLHAAEVAKKRHELHAIDGFISEWKIPRADIAPPQAQPAPVAVDEREAGKQD